MDKKLRFMINGGKFDTDISTGIGYTIFYPTKPSSITDAVVMGNSERLVPDANYPEKCEFIHAGDAVTDEDGQTKYRYNLRLHGECWLDLAEFKRLCEKNLPGFCIGEDSTHVYFKCSEELDGREILTPSDAVFAPSVYQITVTMLPPEDYTYLICHMNITIYLEDDAGELLLTSSQRVTGERTVRLSTPAAAAPYKICYTHKNLYMSSFALKKSNFVMAQYDNMRPLYSGLFYDGVSKAVYLDEPLRSLTDTDGTVCADEYSLVNGIVTRNIRECRVDGNCDFTPTYLSEQRVFILPLNENIAYPVSPSESSAFTRADNPSSLVGTEYHYAIGNSGKQIYFTLPAEYTSAAMAKEFFRENPITVIYKLKTPRQEQAEKLPTAHKAGYTVLEAASLHRPKVKVEYAL